MLKKFLIGTFLALAFLVVASQASADCSITSTLRVGSSGTEVQCLQTKVGATADGAFGPLTKASVMAYQSNNGLSADGVVGPLTRAVLNGSVAVTTGCPAGALFNSVTGASCSSTLPAGCSAGALYSSTTGLSCSGTVTYPAGCTSSAGYSPTTGASCATGTVVTPTVPLAGTAGTVTFTQLSQYSSEEIGSGQNDVKIAGFELKAADGDVALKSFKLTLDATGYAAGDSTRIVDFLDSVSIWQGTTKIGTANTVDFTRDSTGVYSKVVAVSGSIVRDGATEKFYVTADAANNIDSADIDSDSWTVDIINVRYEDGSGVVSTDTITLTAVPIAFVTAATATNTVLKISLDNTPVAGVVDVSTTANTNNVVLLKGKFKVEGTSDIWMDTLPIQLTATNSGDGSIAAITGSVSLTLGSNTYTEAINATNCVAEADYTTVQDCTAVANIVAGVLFDNLNYTLTAGSTVNFTVKADINDIENTGLEPTDFDEGDSLKAELTVAARALAAFVVENKNGDALAAAEKTGSALGEVQTFRDTGINVAYVSSTAVISHAGDINNTLDHDEGTFTITFDVTAFGADMYVDGTKPVEGTGSATVPHITITGADTYIDSNIRSSTGAVLSGDIDVDGEYLVVEGTTERFTITYVTAAATPGGLVQASLPGVTYGDAAATGNTLYNYNMAEFKTPSLNLNFDSA